MSLCTTDAWIVMWQAAIGDLPLASGGEVGDEGDEGESFESKEWVEIETTMHGGHGGEET